MTVASIVGADKVLNELKLLVEKEKSCTICLKAPPGRGKSWIVSQLMEQIADPGYCWITLSGDSSRKNEAFYPLKQFVEKKDRIRNKALNVAKELTGRIPYVGKEIQVLLKDYDFKKHKTAIQDISPFKQHIDFSLHLLGLHRKYQKAIIVCDDLESFDDNTLTFLSELKEGFIQLNEGFNLSFLLVSDLEIRTHKYFGVGNTYDIVLPELSLAQIKELVFFWAAKNISSDQLSLVNSCTGGHLSLIKLVAEHLKEVSEFNTSQRGDVLLHAIVDARLRKEKDRYDILKSLLQAIVKSGKQRTTYEMLCLLDEEKDIKELVQYAIQMDLLMVKNNYIYFTHPIIEDYVASIQSRPKSSFYEKLSVCIKKLTPSNYSRRALVEQLAQNLDQADVFWALAAIQKLREGSFAEAAVLQKEISSSEYGSEIVEALNQFHVCYEFSFKGEIDGTLLEIEQISNSLPKEILAEKNFLKCENLAKKISNLPKEDALNIISYWEDIKEEEPEIWYRLMQLRIITASELGLIDLAKRTEADIVKYFSSRIAYDVHARSILEKLSLFSEVIYNPEIAHKKMLQAEKWLSKEVANEQYHKVIDLFIARTNLSSNSILVNNMEKSIQCALDAVALAKEFDEVRFPGIEAPLSNYYLALMWTDFGNLPSIVEGYREMYNATYVEENKILIDINYAGFLALNGQLAEAAQVLKAGAYIPNKNDDDHYYCYYYWSNYALITYLQGKPQEAKKHLSGLSSTAENVSVFLKKYYVRHYQLLSEIFDHHEVLSFERVRKYIEEKQPILESRIWDRFKLGYLLTDVQLWTSS